jgi:3-hydroxyacyl-[acyl-carrier-protein] dehydratase
MGHFPDAPVMPGVMIVEAMAQAGAIMGLLHCSPEAIQNSLVYFIGIDEARFRRPIVPGDQLRIEVDVLRHKGRVWKMKGQVLVEGELAAEATLLSSISPKP